MTDRRILRASNFRDVVTLAHCVRSTPPADFPLLLSVVHDLGLMRCRLPYGPMLWLVRKVKGRGGLREFFARLQRSHPETVAAFIAQTAEHIMDGLDLEDADSVGGWSQREIDALLGQVSFTFLQEPDE